MPGATLGLAVSGGADSLALLLLAAEARPNLIETATVDHGLRPEAPSEAEHVASICSDLNIPHATLSLDWASTPHANLQAQAREGRYERLAQWARERELDAVATAHHADDQAETLLMRLARGSGVAGLGGIRPVIDLDNGLKVVRPLLDWTRAELHEVVRTAGLKPVNDPTNRDPRFDRSNVRALLASADWIDPSRLAASARNARDAEEALDWAAAREFEARVRREDGEIVRFSPAGLPRELKRRLLAQAMKSLGAAEPAGPDLMHAIDRLEAGERTTLGGIMLVGGPEWRLSIAPPRRR